MAVRCHQSLLYFCASDAMTSSPGNLQRYARRVGVGLAPSERIDGDPVGWAAAQLRSVPPIGILEPDGRERADLPEGLRLRGSGDELMHDWQRHMDTVAQVRARSASLGEAAFRREFTERVGIPYFRLEPWKEVQARATTAVHGPAPVFERFWHFWTNHFTVAPGTMQNEVLVGPHQRALRERMTGSFRDLLWQAVTHPGMLVYLDNVRNTGPNSRARRERWTRDSVNENLGRELLELFTLSPAAGYTQQDVEQATLVLTGWRVQRPDRSHRPGIPLGTRFAWDWHEPGAQTVLGKRYQALFKPESKLVELIDDLAAHPATARHLAHKLCVQFIDDEPRPMPWPRSSAPGRAAPATCPPCTRPSCAPPGGRWAARASSPRPRPGSCRCTAAAVWRRRARCRCRARPGSRPSTCWATSGRRCRAAPAQRLAHSQQRVALARVARPPRAPGAVAGHGRGARGGWGGAGAGGGSGRHALAGRCRGRRGRHARAAGPRAARPRACPGPGVAEPRVPVELT